MKNTRTRKELWSLIAANRMARFPDYTLENALYFASHQYPTKQDALDICECLELLPLEEIKAMQQKRMDEARRGY